ncbi:MAG: hypothetical protein Q9221_003533 [Calogaya cf. arnoldii]
MNTAEPETALKPPGVQSARYSPPTLPAHIDVENNRTSMDPVAHEHSAATNRNLTTADGYIITTTTDQNTTAAEEKNDNHSNRLTRSQGAPALEVPRGEQLPIWESVSEEKFWNPVVGDKPDWCWRHHAADVIGDEVAVVLAVDDGERPSAPQETVYTVLVKQAWDQDIKWMYWVLKLNHLNYIAKIHKKNGEIRRFMSGPGGEFDFHPFAFLVEDFPKRQPTSVQSRASNNPKASQAWNNRSDSEDTKAQHLQLVANRVAPVRTSRRSAAARQGLADVQRKRKRTSSNDTFGEDDGGVPELSDAETDGEDQVPQKGREKPKRPRAKRPVIESESDNEPDQRWAQKGQVATEDPLTSGTKLPARRQAGGDADDEDSDQDGINHAREEISVQSTNPTQSHAREIEKLKLQIRFEITLTEMAEKKAKAEADANKKATMNQSLAEDCQALLVEQKKLVKRLDAINVELQEAVRYVDSRREEASMCAGEMEKTKV